MEQENGKEEKKADREWVFGEAFKLKSLFARLGSGRNRKSYLQGMSREVCGRSSKCA